MRERFVTAVIDRLFAVRWIRFGLKDLETVRPAIAAARAQASKPLVYLSLIPASTRTFSETETSALGLFVRGLLPDCESIHHVIDGTGFMSSARRSIVTKLALASPSPSAFHTHATLDEAVRAIAPRLRTPTMTLLEEARAKRIDFPRDE